MILALMNINASSKFDVSYSDVITIKPLSFMVTLLKIMRLEVTNFEG